MARISAVELAAARDRTIPGVLPGPGDPPFSLLFCGINPRLVSAATGHHFARPGNRFWPVLHAAGFTPRLLRPAEQGELAALGLGITNMAPRATARAVTSMRLVSFSFQEQAIPESRQAAAQTESQPGDPSNVLAVFMHMREDRQPAESRPQADEQRQAELRQKQDEERKRQGRGDRR